LRICRKSGFAFADRVQGHALRRAVAAFTPVTGGAVAIAAWQSAGPWIAAVQRGIGG
jgi:hypothetical protein